jgi:hypothetical protein
VCPSGARWDQCISNRTFKAKIIALVCQKLPEVIQFLPGQTLIIDYKGFPTAYRLQDGEVVSEELTSLQPLGEADVKFTRYATMFQDLLVDSIDGDSIPIALLFQEKCIRDYTQGSMDPRDLTEAPPRICIYRITTKTDSEKERPVKKTKNGDTGAEETKTVRCTNRTYEYVNIPMLYLSLRGAFSQSLSVSMPLHSPYLMSLLTALIGLTGTDYTRHMPQMSGKSVFGLLTDLMPLLLRSFDVDQNQLDVESAVDSLVAGIYAAKFGVHVSKSTASRDFNLKSVLQCLRTSKLSQRTRESFPTLDQIECTVRNVNWLLLYWTWPERVPHPIQPQFGFTKNQKGLVTFVDLCCGSSCK